MEYSAGLATLHVGVDLLCVVGRRRWFHGNKKLCVHSVPPVFFFFSCANVMGRDTRMDGGRVRPILRDTPSHKCIVAIIYRLFCNAFFAVIAAITAILRRLLSCDIAAITAILMRLVNVEYTICLSAAARLFAADLFTIDPKTSICLQSAFNGARFQVHIFRQCVDGGLTIHGTGFIGGV